MKCTTPFTLPVRLPEERKAFTVGDAGAARLVELPVYLCRSLTWDQGKEVVAPVTLSMATNEAVYFCDPPSPWQRGTNENTNGRVRRYLNRGLDLGTVNHGGLDATAARPNDRPHETLGWKAPSRSFSELAATTA